MATIKEAREEKGWTQPELVHEVTSAEGEALRKLTQGGLSYVETHSHLASDRDLVAYQKALGQELDALTREDVAWLLTHKTDEVMNLVKQRKGRPRWKKSTKQR